jgi:hypothetical protein
MRSGRRQWKAARSRAITGMLIVPLALAGLIVLPPDGVRVAEAFTGETITGTVFRDFNANGVKDTLDPGQAGVEVRAVDRNNVASPTVTSAANGTYTLNLNGMGNAAADTYRVEFTLPAALAAYLKPGQVPDPATVGTIRNGSDVQFIVAGSAAASNVGFAVENPAQYCQNNPNLAATCFSGIGSSTNRSSLEQFSYTSGTTSTTSNALVAIPAPTDLAFRNTTGSIGPLTHHRATGNIFAAAFAKRHTGYPSGPNNNGPDTIYVYNPTGATFTSFFTAEAGTDAHNYASPVNDINFFDQVGKTAWGKISVSEDDTKLFAVNLFDRSVYVIPINQSGTTVTAGAATILTFPNGTTDCGSNDWRPGGVVQHDGTVYASITCTAQTSQLRTDLKGIVYSSTAVANFTTQVASFPLNYARANATTNGPAAFFPWIDGTSIDRTGATQVHPPGETNASFGQSYYPQPWLTSITFDESDNMVVGITDRAGHQFGNVNGTNTGNVEGVAAGDTMKLTKAGATWGTPQDEFYNTERFDISGSLHNETSLGFVGNQMGSGDIISTVWDPPPVSATVPKPSPPNAAGSTWPNAFRSGGLIWMSSTNGARQRSYQLFGNDDPGTFGKVAGIGDVELICNMAPIEIGNRVFNDANGNGVQDALETGIANVTVHLQQGASVIGTTTTAADGTYYFGGTGNRNVTTALLPNTAYTIRVDNATDYTAGNPLVGKVPSPASVGTLRAIDSNAALPTPNAVIGAGNFPVVSHTTGAAGANDMTLDIGFMPPGSIGDTIFRDYNGNGVPDTGEGISGVTVTVLWCGTDAVCGNADDVATVTTTNASGVYLARNLPPGSYRVTVNTAGIPAGLVNTTDPDGGNDSVSLLTLGVGANNLNQDFGYRAQGSIGDRVWHDVNNNAAQDVGEAGLVGVAVSVRWCGIDNTCNNTDDVVFNTTTGANGIYGVTNLEAGTYIVTTSSLPSGITTPTFDLDGTGTPNTATTTLTAGQARTDVDFGYRGSGSIGDTIFLDLNGNNTFEAGEGLAGVGVTVNWCGINTTCGDGDDIAYPTTTTGDGFYLVSNLPGGNYTVTVNTANLPTGVTNIADPDGGFNSASALSLAAGTSNVLQDFGYRGSGQIGDTIWHDVDGNGAQNGTEPGVSGVPVTVRWCGTDNTCGNADDKTYSRTTSSTGAYLVTGLPQGNYTVTVTTTGTLAGLGLVTNTGDPDGGADSTSSLTLPTGGSNLSQDFGYRGSGSIGDTIFLDSNANGLFEAGEGLPGVGVTVRWSGPNNTLGDADDVLYPTTTTGDGFYLVSNLPGGNYSVTVTTATLPLGVTNTVDPDGGANSTSALTLASGASNLLQDFGYRGSGQIGDTIWHDVDGNGAQNGSEPGVANVPVLVRWCGTDGTCGNADDKTFPRTTDATGKYLVTDLPAGNFTVTVTTTGTLAGLGLITNTGDPDGGANSSAALTLAAAGSNLNQDFGYQGTGQIGDTIFLDLNNSGFPDAGEGLMGVGVTVRWAGPNGTFGDADDIDYSRTTDASGLYLATFLPAGSFRVIVNTATLPIGVTNTVDPDGGLDSLSALTLASGGSNLLQDFGYRGSGQIGDTIWHDVDGNGAQNGSEPGVANVPVLVRWCGTDGTCGNADDKTFSRTTSATGTYLVTDLPGGSYTVTVTTTGTLAGLGLVTNTGDPDGGANSASALTLPAAGSNLNQDFGYRGTGQIGDTIFLDLNANNTFEAGEGLAGIGVTVRWAGPDGTLGNADDILYPTTTTGDGFYLVTSLPAGSYSVTVNTASLPAGVTNTVDPDGGLDSVSALTLASGGSNLLQDFGYRGSGQIGDTIWHDIDGNGAQNGSEPGVANVPVLVRWCGTDGTCGNADDKLYPRTTDALGTYLATGLPAGNFTVTVTTTGTLAGLGLSTNTGDPDGGFDSVSALTLATGGSNLNQDFGYRGSGQIGDTIFLDLNGNGTFEAGEGLAGIGVTVNWCGADGTCGNADDVAYPTTTIGDGLYLVSNLPGGNYTVTVNTANLPTGVTNIADPDGGFDSVSALTLPGGGSNLLQDFGYRGSGQIGDTIWHDVDGNGAQNGSEPGVANVAVLVRWCGTDNTCGNADDKLYPRTTDVLGQYLATGLPAGSFTVTVTTTGTLATLGLVTNTGDPDGGFDSASAVTLATGGSNLNQDFGYRGSGSIGDTIFHDYNGNGLPDAGEGIPAVAVTVRWAGPDGTFGNADDIDYPRTTDGSGLYLATSLPAGSFRVIVNTATIPPTLANTTDPDGGNDSISALVLAANTANLLQDFGYRDVGVIGDTVWQDTNSNSFPDAGEALVNVAVSVRWCGLDATCNTGDDLVTNTTTDVAGHYLATQLPPGTYVVTVTTTGVITTLSLSNVIDPDGGNNSTSQLVLPAGGSNLNQDFAYRRIANDKMYYFSLGGTTGPGTGPGQYRQMLLTSPIALFDQQLVVQLRNGYVPAVGDSFDIVVAPQITGSYRSSYGTILANGVVLDAQYLPGVVRLVATKGLFVNSLADTVDLTPGNGVCADVTGFCSLRAATMEANALAGRQSIVLPSGGTFALTRAGSDDTGSTGDLDLNEDVTLFGPSTIVDGAGAGDRVVHVRNNANGHLQGLTIRNGNVTAGGAGGVFVEGATATVDDVTITNNSGPLAGGIGALNSTVTYNRGIITNNTSGSGGGGVVVLASPGPSTLVLDRAVVTNNNGTQFGGGLLALGNGALLEVRDATVTNNSAQIGGGGAAALQGEIRLTRGVFTSNTATVKGGGLAVDGRLTVNEGAISSNTAPMGAGVAILGGAVANMDRVTINNNTASVAGGGIRVEGGTTATLTTSTISTNAAPLASAIDWASGAPLQLNSVTITANSSSGGGAIVAAAAGGVSLTNSIVADQVVGANCAGVAGGVTSGGYNLTNTGSLAACGLTGTGDAQAASALLGSLSYNGGTGLTHEPSANSAAVNTGGLCPAKDQRGFKRPRMGACEKGSLER